MRFVLSLLLLISFTGCFVEGSVDERGDAVCRSQGLVIFTGRIQMTGESIIDIGDLPKRWRIVGEDVSCDINLDVVQVPSRNSP